MYGSLEQRGDGRWQLRFTRTLAHPIEGEMLAYEPPSLLELRWGTDVLRIELRPLDGVTELTLVAVLDDVGKGVRDGAGWHTCLDALEARLAGSAAAREQLGRWAEVQPRYADRFPPEAAVIGPPDGME